MKGIRKTRYAIEINGNMFPNGRALQNACRDRLNKYLWPGCPAEISMEDDDAGFFISLVRSRDPGRIEKQGYVKDVVRTTREGNVGRHLCFIYGNGVRDMIGWSKMCAGAKKNRQLVNDALRHVVACQAQAEYARAFSAGVAVCPKSNVTLSSTGEFAADSGVVHHDGKTFAEIRDEWMRLNGLTYDDISIVEREEGGVSLTAGDVMDSWSAFHAKESNLVVVSKRWHDEHHAAELLKEKEVLDVVDEAPSNCGTPTVSDLCPATTPGHTPVDLLGLHGLR